MFGNNEIVLLSMDEKDWNVSFSHVPADWIQILNVEAVLSADLCTLSLIVDLMNIRAIPLKIESPPPCFSARSLLNFYRLLKGESHTMQPIS